MRMVLLNPGPANTSDAVKRAQLQPDICPREPAFCDVLRAVRDGLTRVVHQGDGYTTVLFAGSGTAAVEAAVCSTVPADGRLLVLDNGSYGKRITQIAKAYAMPCDSEVFGVGEPLDLSRVAELLSTERYTHVAVIHHETSTGILNPIGELGPLCRDHGAHLIVDAMSSYAGIPIDIEAIGADYLVSSSNKCIQGMAGLSFVVCRRELLEALEPIPGRSFYLNMSAQHRYLEEQGQMQFTPPVQVVYALQQALEEYFAEGGRERHKRYLANWQVLDHGMRELGFRRLLPTAILSRILTAYIEPDHPTYSFEGMHDRLYEKGFTIYPGKGARKDTFRLANMGDIGVDDMRAFLIAMEQTIEELRIRPLYSS